MEELTNGSEQPKKVETYNELIRALTEISDELDISYAGVSGTYNATRKLVQTGSFTGPDVVREFIHELVRSKKDVKEQLDSINIKTAEDIGRIVFALCDRGLLKKEENDSMDVFRNIFTSENIKAYIKKEKIGVNRVKQLGNLFYIIGFALILLAYTRVLKGSFVYIGSCFVTVGWIIVSYEKKINNWYKRWRR